MIMVTLQVVTKYSRYEMVITYTNILTQHVKCYLRERERDPRI